MSETFATIKLAAKHNKLTLVKDAYLVAGNVNSVYMSFDLRTDDWVTCQKIKAVFNDFYTRDLSKNFECDIPHEVLVSPDEFSVSLIGVNGKVRLGTNKLYFRPEEGSTGFDFDIGEASDEIIIYDGGDVYGY